MNGLSKNFTFKKIDFTGCGRKINQPEVELTLKYNKDNKPVMTISGEIWNSRHTDCLCCGQCLEEMASFVALRNDPTFNKLYYLWLNYHLNDMVPGTVAQETALKAYHEGLLSVNKHNWTYSDDKKYLESIGLLFDNGYEYGSSWLYREIPKDDLDLIEELLDS